MAYSTQRAVSDGTLVLLNLSIDYFDRSEISVLFAGVVSPIGSGKWNWVGTTNTQIAFTPAVANGVEVTIKRSTQLAAPLNQYTKGAQFVAETLDQNFNQVLRIAQESSEGAGAKDVYNDVDYHGFKIVNVGAASNPTDAVSLGQYQADAAGAKVARDQAVAAAGTAAGAISTTAASAAASAASATNAATSEANALASKNAAATSASTADTRATAASTSATNAAASATNAATSETNALSSKNAAATSAASVVRDGSGGVAGLTGFLLNLYNAVGSIKSALASAATAARTWTLPDKSGTVALTSDVADPVLNSMNGGALAGMRNLITNGNFAVNQRGYAGAATSTANQYTLDRWRVVVSGQASTFVTSANGRTVTAPAGGLEQVVDGANIGVSVAAISWVGSASCTVDGVARASGAAVTLTPGVNCTIRFSGGTVGSVQLEPGPVATPFEQRPYGLELLMCQRYFWQITDSALGVGLAYSATSVNASLRYPVVMRAVPTVIYTNPAAVSVTAGGGNGFNCTVASVFIPSPHSVELSLTIGTSSLTAGSASLTRVSAAGAIQFSAEF